MGDGQSFKDAWLQTAADRALLPNSVDSYWSWTKLFYKFTGTGAAHWTGRDWERFERWTVCNAAIERGWKWNPCGEGFSRLCGLGRDVHPVSSERDVFEFVGLEYLEPWERK